MNQSDVKICRRVNNKKRNFLVLNTRQCKHVPASAKDAFVMFDELADKVKSRYSGENVLVVGFAETATAIGEYIALECGYTYIHTTRENRKFEETLHFEETHSHAVEQKLRHIDFSLYDRVVFVEDEVTTGSTILHIVNIIHDLYTKMKFGVASILNGMKDSQLSQYEELGIPVDYLLSIDNSKYSNIADGIPDNGFMTEVSTKSDVIYCVSYGGIPDMRYGHKTKNWIKTLDDVYDYVRVSSDDASDVLILGTEEFMYPAMYVAEKLEDSGVDYVSCHSTTRSPISVSSEKGYPLNSVYKIPSVYDLYRDSFIYNLRHYDKVFIITEDSAENVGYLVEAVKLAGNKVNNIDVIMLNTKNKEELKDA